MNKVIIIGALYITGNSVKTIFFSLILLCEEDKISRTIGPQVALEQLIQSKGCFSATMASRLELVNKEYIEQLKGQDRKWKHEEQQGVVKERFQKVGKWKKLASKFRRVRKRRPRPTIVSVSVKHSETQ